MALAMIAVSQGDDTRQELRSAFNIQPGTNFDARHLKPALNAGYVTLTIPDNPRSRLQECRLTDKGPTVDGSMRRGTAEL